MGMTEYLKLVYVYTHLGSSVILYQDCAHQKKKKKRKRERANDTLYCYAISQAG